MRIAAHTLFRALGITFFGVAILWIVFGLIAGNLSFSLAIAGFNAVIAVFLLLLARRAQTR